MVVLILIRSFCSSRLSVFLLTRFLSFCLFLFRFSSQDYDKVNSMFVAHSGWYNDKLVHYYKFMIHTVRITF